MNIKDNFFELWNGKAREYFNKSIEDNQLISLPMITLLNGEKYVFAFVISICKGTNEVQILQKHFWNFNEHKIILDRKRYFINRLDIQVLADESFREDYYYRLTGIIDFSFNNEISNEQKSELAQYMQTLQKTGSLNKIHLLENKVFAEWISKNIADSY